MTDITAGERVELTEDQIDALIKDPATIPDHETALELMAILDHEMAGIQAQVDAKAARYNGRPMPDIEEDWLRRATYASAMRKSERHKIYMRDKELRGMKGPAQLGSDPELKANKAKANLIKQERLLAEADIRRIQKKLDLENARIERARLELRVRDSLNRMKQ